MKIFYDLIYLAKEQQGGISRMWLEYFKLIPKSGIDASFLIRPDVDNITNKHLKEVKYYNYPVIEENVHNKNKYLRLPRKLGFCRNLLLLKLIPSDTQIFHSTDFINPLFRPRNTKIVTTIHDMVFWDQKEKFKKNIFYWDEVWSIYHSLKISDRIVTVSEASKKAIINRFPWTEKKIAVIYHGLSDNFMKLELKPNKQKYFMLMGGRNDYKNYDLLLEAFSHFVKEFPEWKIQVVGANRYSYKKEQEKYNKLGITDKIIDYGLVTEENLIGLLQEASALVIPSLNEGFNFPLLEAMAAACPVLSLDIPVSKEIGSDFVTFFSNDVKSLSMTLKNHALSKFNQEKLIKAQKYARTFNWEKSFHKLINVYESCI